MATHLRFQPHVHSGVLPRLETRSDAPKQARPRAAKPIEIAKPNNYWRAPQRPLRRVMTREQGRALEMIGHAVDYLNDFYIQEGPDEEVIHLAGASTEAVRLLIGMRSRIFQSLPLVEPLSTRFWNAVFGRKSEIQSSVLPLSSSR